MKAIGCGLLVQYTIICLTIALYFTCFAIVLWSLQVSFVYGIVAIVGLITQVLPLVVIITLIGHLLHVV